MGELTVGEMRQRSDDMDLNSRVVVISTDDRLRHLKLRVVAFYLDVDSGTGRQFFKIKVEVDDLKEPA